MDIIRDILDRISQAVDGGCFTDQIAEQIERQIRQDWGGERPYIPKSGETDQAEMGQRNAAILRDWQAGERAPAIARKYRISRARVWQIIGER